MSGCGRPKKGKRLRGRDPSVLQRLKYVVEVIGQDTPITHVTTKHLDKVVAALGKHRGKAKGLPSVLISRPKWDLPGRNKRREERYPSVEELDDGSAVGLRDLHGSSGARLPLTSEFRHGHYCALPGLGLATLG
jgi:hypothetical protein